MGTGGPRADATPLAKLTRPAAPEAVPRERLFGTLEKGPAGAVWIGGPAGVGKTTLAASYVEARGLTHAWFRIDEADADPATFFYYLGLAARNAAPRRRRPLPLLTPEYLPGLATFARHFFRELYGRLKAPFALVFDNVHELPEDSPVHGILRVAVEELPEGGRMLLLGRGTPGPELAGLLADGRLGTLGDAILGFDPDETEALLTRWGLGGDAALAGRLHRKTLGWVAGMVLMRGHLAGGGTPAPLLTPDTVYDYFAGELLSQADERVRRFLMATAVLPETTVPMARRLTGADDAGRILRDLDRRNFFIERLPLAKPVYRYHALFREFLLREAERRLEADALERLRREAATVLEEAGQTGAALELLAGAGAWDESARVIRAAAPALAAQGRHGTLTDWIDRLPPERLQTDPALSLWAGIGRLPFDPEAARPHLVAAWEAFVAAGDREGALLAWPAIIDTYQYAWSDFRPLNGWIEALEALAGPNPAFSDPEVEARVTVGMVNALYLHRPDHPALPAWEARVERLMGTLPDPSQRILLGARLAQGHTTTGNFRKGERLLDALGPDLRSPDATPLAVLTYLGVRATFDWLTGHPGACLRTVDKALALSRETGVFVCDYLVLAQGAYGRLTAGDTAGAAEVLERMRPLLVPSRRVDMALFHYLATWKALLENNLAAAREYAETSLRHAARSGMPLAEGLVNLAMGHTLFELGDAATARSHLARAFRIARGMGSDHMRFMAWMTAAHFALRRGEERRADKALAKGMALGRERGFANFAVWLPGVMSGLCARALAAGIEPDYVRTLVRRRHLRPPDPVPATPGGWPWALSVRALGSFELAVGGEPVRFSRKAQRRPLDLLKVLVALGGRAVPDHRVADALWPDAEGDAAQRTLAVTLHRLRQLLGDEAAVTRADGRIGLDGALCWLDTWAFERLLDEAEAARAAGDPATWRTLAEQALELYRGPLLADAELPDAVPLATRLRTRFLGASLALGAALAAEGEAEGACARYLAGIRAEPCAEPLHLALMQCLAGTGRPNEAAAAYAPLRDTLQATRGEAPSAKARALYAEVLRGATTGPPDRPGESVIDP